MRRLVLALSLAILGCGKGGVPASATVAKPSGDPVALRRDEDEQAAFSLDAACASIEDALTATKRLAPVAGGDAKEALLDVAEMLDSAGATLADHHDNPPPLEEYRRVEAEWARERQETVKDALDALQELRDAQGVLEDLAENVPKEHAQPLQAILAQTEEAADAVEDAIPRLGGKVPPEEEPDDATP